MTYDFEDVKDMCTVAKESYSVKLTEEELEAAKVRYAELRLLSERRAKFLSFIKELFEVEFEVQEDFSNVVTNELQTLDTIGMTEKEIKKILPEYSRMINTGQRHETNETVYTFQDISELSEVKFEEDGKIISITKMERGRQIVMPFGRVK